MRSRKEMERFYNSGSSSRTLYLHARHYWLAAIEPTAPESMIGFSYRPLPERHRAVEGSSPVLDMLLSGSTISIVTLKGIEFMIKVVYQRTSRGYGYLH